MAGKAMEYAFVDAGLVPRPPADLETAGIITYLFVADLELGLVHVVDSRKGTHAEPLWVVGTEARRRGVIAPLERVGVGIIQWIFPDEFSIRSTAADPLPDELMGF